MKHLLTSFLFMLCVVASAQTQQGIVKTRGRMDNGQLVAGTRLSGATVTLSFGNSLVSGSQGEFSFNVPSGKTYSLVMAQKKGYTLADPEYTRRSFTYSSNNPFYVVLEDVNQRQADINAATRKVRRTLTAQLQAREDEIEALKEQNKLTEEEYQKRLQELYDNQSKSEQLVKEMAERYASTDYDQLDEFNSQVQMYIEEGELQKADSMIRSKGDMEKRVEEYLNTVKANKQERQELDQREAQLEQSEAGAAKTYEDLSQDLLRKSEIFLQEFKHDSVLYYLKLRADLDTTNVDAVWLYARSCSHQKKFTDCKQYYHICLSIFVQNQDIPNIAEIQNNLGVLYYSLNDYTNSEKSYNVALENMEQLFQQNPEAYRQDLAMIQNNLGALYCNFHDYKNSEKYHKAALVNCEQLFQQNPDAYRQDLAMVQNNLGKLYFILHDYTKSEKYLKLSLENKEKLFKLNPDAYRQDLVSTQSNLGYLCSDLHDYTNCEKYFKAALENQEQLYLQNPDAYRPGLASIQSDLGLLYFNLHDYTNCEKYFKSALDNYEQLFQQNPDAYRPSLAMVQNNLGTLYRDLLDHTNSEKYFKSALDNYEQLFQQNPNAYRTDLAWTQDNLGSLYANLHDYTNGEKYFKSALENKEKLFLQNPDVYRPDLATTLHNFGSLYLEHQDYTNSEKHLMSALQNREQLFQQNPNAYRADLAMTQNNLGALYKNLHDYTKSVKYYKLALKNKEQLFLQYPDAYRQDLAIAYWNKMLLYEEMDNIEQYDQYLERSLKLFKELNSIQSDIFINNVIQLQNRKVWRLLVKGNVDEALTLAQETLSMNESDEITKNYLAECYKCKAFEYSKDSDYSNAHKSIDKAISMRPENVNFYNSKGEILLMQGKNDEALNMWKKVLELNPDFLKGYPDGSNLSNGLKKLGLIE